MLDRVKENQMDSFMLALAQQIKQEAKRRRRRLLAVFALVLLVIGLLFWKLENNNQMLRQTVIESCERRNLFLAQERKLYLHLAEARQQQPTWEDLYESIPEDPDCLAYRN